MAHSWPGFWLLAVIFGVILLLSAAPVVFKMGEELPQGVINDRLASRLRLASSYPDHRLGHDVSYQVIRTPFGLAMMYVAGVISGLLGIGSGTFKVVALDLLMRLPMKVSTTTSNFMIGVTAAASAGIYFSRGDILLVLIPLAFFVLRLHYAQPVPATEVAATYALAPIAQEAGSMSTHEPAVYGPSKE